MELVRPEAARGQVGKHISSRTVRGPGKPLKARRYEDVLKAGIPLGSWQEEKGNKSRLEGEPQA